MGNTSNFGQRVMKAASRTLSLNTIGTYVVPVASIERRSQYLIYKLIILELAPV